MPDPVSWLQIEQGWRIVGSDGAAVGTVAQVEGVKEDDIFDGIAVELTGSESIRYVQAEKVGAIYPGEVRLTVAADDAGALEPFEPAPPVTTWRPEKPSLGSRISGWFRGSRR
jgi:hypothetical protein